jgi:hypothetical protein
LTDLQAIRLDVAATSTQHLTLTPSCSRRRPTMQRRSTSSLHPMSSKGSARQQASRLCGVWYGGIGVTRQHGRGLRAPQTGEGASTFPSIAEQGLPAKRRCPTSAGCCAARGRSGRRTAVVGRESTGHSAFPWQETGLNLHYCQAEHGLAGDPPLFLPVTDDDAVARQQVVFDDDADFRASHSLRFQAGARPVSQSPTPISSCR